VTEGRRGNAERADRPPTLRLVGGVAASTPEALIEQAETAESQGRQELARELYERALHRLDATVRAGLAPSLMLGVARTYRASGNPLAALDCVEAAIAVASTRGDEITLGQAINLRALVLWEQGELAEAEREHARARETALRAGDSRLAAAAERSLGALCILRGDANEALLHYETSLAELRALGSAPEVVEALGVLGDLHVDLERWDEAERAFSEATQIAGVLGDLVTIARLEIRRGEMWAARSDLERARDALDRAIDLSRRVRDTALQGETARLGGVLARELGDFARAEEQFTNAERLAHERPDNMLAAETAREKAELFRRQERHRDTLMSLNRAYRFLSQLRGRSTVVEIATRTRRLERDFLGVVRRWGQSIEAKDLNTRGHCERVADLTVAIGDRLGVDQRSLFWYRVGALVHDVGKLIIPTEVLNKAGRLTAEEWSLVKRHPVAGAEMLAGIDFPWDVRPIVESHHECWDGSGYPYGIGGAKIPLAARVVCIADVYDVLTSQRSFKRALSHAEAMEVMRRDVGRQFDPDIFRVFEEVIGSRVALFTSSGEPATETAPRGAPRREALARRDDPHTGALARAPFFAAAHTALADRRGTGKPVSLLLIDIDHFRLVNDTYGTLQGDDVLWAVSQILQRGLRTGDLVGRYGGDEFVVLLPDAPLAKAREIAERLRISVSGLRVGVRDTEDTTVAVTLSIGVATSVEHGDTPESLVAAADRALFAARARGNDTVVVAEADSASTPAARMQFDRFVGRTEELRTLANALEHAARGEPRIVAVVGEAGIGKSSLLRHLEPEVRLRAGSMVIGHARDATVKTPYAPWAELLTSLHSLGHVAERQWRELARLVPALGSGTAPAPVTDGNRYILLEELAEYIRLAVAARPMVLVLEDIQWADEASWDAFEYVLEELDHDRVLICVTIRGNDAREIAQRRWRLSRDKRFSQITLRRLTVEELKRWLETVFHQGDIGLELPSFLHEYTEGNPLLVQQVLRALGDEGGIWYAGTRWEWKPIDEMRLPTAWTQLLERRLERLSPRARSILATASVLGGTFDADLLVATGAGNEHEIEGAIDEGRAASVLEPVQGSGERRFQFRHGILAETVRRGIPERHLQRLYEMAARALELRSPTAVADITRLYHASGNDEQAYRYALLAAERASSVYAHDEAAACLLVAQRHAPSSQALVDAQIRLAHVAEAAGRYDQAEEMCDLALEFFGAQPDPSRSLPVRRLRERLRSQRGQPVQRTYEACRSLLAEAEAAGERGESGALLILLSQLQSRMLEWDGAERFARRAVQVTESLTDRRLHAEALLRLGTALLETRPSETLDRYREALTLFMRAHDRYGQIRCWINTGIAHSRAGYSAAAAEAYDMALELGRQAHAPDLTGLASLNLGVLMLKSGEYARSRELLEDALRLFTTVRNEPNRVAALYNLGHLARERGDSEGAVELYDIVADRARDLGMGDIEIGAEAGAGLALLDRDVDAALIRWRRVEAAMPATSETLWFQGRELVEALEVRAALAVEQPSDAVQAFSNALPIVDRHDPYAASWFVAECAMPLARAGLFAVSETVTRYLPRAESAGFSAITARYDLFREWMFGAPKRVAPPPADSQDLDAT
jgi:diguanylate cyclase (GGDEF)-like protein/putative nucleotidyltransferase with HDIG domain